MAKKKPVPKRKPSSAKKPASKKPASRKKTTASKKTALTSKNTALDDSANLPDAGIHQQNIPLLPDNLMEDITGGTRSNYEDFIDISNNNLTALQRRRKTGAGIKNYGFIDKVSDLAAANPKYAQFFRLQDLKNCIRNIETCRDLLVLLQAFARAVSNTMLVYSDDAYSMALIYYNNVRELSRRGDPEAMELFRTLQPFFRRPRRTGEEPTERELERDLHALIHGKKDGKIVIENFSPAKSDGVHKVVDDVHKGKAMIKESAEAEMEN